MGLFDKIKKEEILQDNQQEEPKNMNIDEMSNYILSDIRKEDLNNDFDVFPISKLVELSPLLGEMTNKLNSINEIIPTSKNKMYKVTNLKGGTLAQNKKTGLVPVFFVVSFFVVTFSSLFISDISSGTLFCFSIVFLTKFIGFLILFGLAFLFKPFSESRFILNILQTFLAIFAFLVNSLISLPVAFVLTKK